MPIWEDVKFLKNNDDVTKWVQTKKYNIIKKKSQSPGSQNWNTGFKTLVNKMVM